MIFQYFLRNNAIAYVYTDEYGFVQVDDDVPDYCTHTWSFHEQLYGKGIEFATFYCEDCSIENSLPPKLAAPWKEANEKLTNLVNVAATAKIDLSKVCIIDLADQNYMKDFCMIKNQVIRSVFMKCERPPYTNFLEDLSKMVSDISKQPLNINLTTLRSKSDIDMVRDVSKRVHCNIEYLPLGAKLGRLRTAPGSFNIHNLRKDFRDILEPHNDRYIELDYNSAEARVFLALSEIDQPDYDIHQWNCENIFGDVTRDEAKEIFFAWLYDSRSEKVLKYDENLTKYYKKGIILEKFWDGEFVTDYYGRTIEANAHKAVNAIMQSTASGLFLRQMIKVHQLLENMKSFVAFSIHDCLVIDFSEEDSKHLREIRDIFRDTDLGLFKTNISIGKNYGEMKKI